MINNSREIAFKILKKVFKDKSYSNILLNEVSNMEIENKFKNLIFAIVHGTISNKIILSYITGKNVDNKKTNIDIQILLWMSIYQIRFLKSIPQYAVVNESVSIAKKINPKLSGLVNAVLKNIIKNEEELFDFSNLNDKKRVCIENSFPGKLFEMIEKDYGFEVAKNIAEDSIKKPPISFRVNTLLMSTEELYEKYKEKYNLKKTEIKDCLISENPIVKSDLYKNGYIIIQDQASILVANILNPAKDSKVLDMCSAPGGKLTHLSMIMQNTGQIDAYEISSNKISLIQENITRLNCKNINLINADATTIKNEQYDFILLDAPCSGFGVLKRKPEIKFNNIDDKGLNETFILQEKLLETAYKSLKVGGQIVYSTCTINKKENSDQILKITNKHKDLQIIEEKQLFGYENNTDGFYICKLIKK